MNESPSPDDKQLSQADIRSLIAVGIGIVVVTALLTALLF